MTKKTYPPHNDEGPVCWCLPWLVVTCDNCGGTYDTESEDYDRCPECKGLGIVHVDKDADLSAENVYAVHRLKNHELPKEEREKYKLMRRHLN